MIKDIEMIEKLFSDNEKDIYEALLYKKNWLNIKLIKEGNLDYYIDSNKIKRYPFLENLFDNVLMFKKAQYDGNKKEYTKIINQCISKFSILILSTKLKIKKDVPFYVEYDFNKLDELGYRSLIANVYKMYKENDLNINYEDLNNITNQIKLCLIGNEDDYCFILNDESLINGCFFLPIVSKIYITNKINEDLFKELELFSKENKVQLEYLYEN